MSEEEERNLKKKSIKDKVIPDVEIKEGRGSEFADGVSDTTVGIAKTIVEVARAPLRAAGRMVDGTLSGAKQGVQQSSNPVEGTVKASTGTVIGASKGVVAGVKAAVKKVGEGLRETGDGLKKVGSSLSPNKQDETEE